MRDFSAGRSGTEAAARRLLAGLLLAVVLPAGPAAGYAPDGAGADLAGDDSETLPVDVVVRVVNGTTRGTGKAEAVTLQEIGPVSQVVGTARDVAGEAVLKGLFLDETRTYLVQVTSGGIPYFARKTGQDLAAGPVTVYVFEATTDRGGLTVEELTLNLRRTESDLRLEYLVTVQNRAEPQRTVLPDPTSFELLLPEGAVGAACEVLAGAEPQRVAPVAGVKPTRAGLAVPLRSGATRLRVTTSLPYEGSARLAVESSLPVARFTLNTSPADLRISDGFADEGVAEDTGWRRWAGPALAADQELRWSVSGGSAPRIAERAEEGSGGAAGGRLEQVRRTGTSLAGWIVIVVAVLMVALALLPRLRGGGRRGGADDGRD